MTSHPANPGPWVEHAACKDMVDQMAMPERLGRVQMVAHISRARTICRHCPVLDDCRTWALTDPDPAYGMIAGAMDPTQRRAERRRLASHNPAPFYPLVVLADRVAHREA